jgi:hypothetical protein
MRISQEQKNWNSFNKEFEALNKKASRIDAPQVEKDYFSKMANATKWIRDGIVVRKEKKRFKADV